MKGYLFVDGSNLYAGQYMLFGPKKYLDFCKFVKSVEDSLKIKFDKIYFYTSFSPRPKVLTAIIKAYLTNESYFYKSVRSTKNVTFFKGYRSPTSNKEKEVDVKMAVDIVNMAHLDKYKNVFVMSGDADFLHALKIAEGLGKWITILALENRIPYRFSYLYKTYIFKTNKKFKVEIKKPQKIEVVDLGNGVVGSIKKSPRYKYRGRVNVF